jgi:hypothetical protein
MDPLTIALNWVTLGTAIFKKGQAAWDDIKAVLVKHGIEHDTEALDAAILDADRRKALAVQDAAGPTPAGTTGE